MQARWKKRPRSKVLEVFVAFLLLVIVATVLLYIELG